MIKFVVSTFLVYKAKKCLLKSGKVIGLSVNKHRASTEQASGIHCPHIGQQVPKIRS